MNPGADTLTAALVRDALARNAAGGQAPAGTRALARERETAVWLESRYPGLGRMILTAYAWHRARIEGSLTGWSARFPVPRAAGAVIAGAPLPVPGSPLHARAAAAAPGARFAYTAPHPLLADALAGQVAGPEAGRVSVVLARAADPDSVMASGPVTEMTALGPVAVHLVLAPARWAPDLAPGVIARYAELAPPGSTVSLSVITAEPGPEGAAMMGDASLAGSRGYCHCPADVARWLTGAGLALHPDGARTARSWHRDWARRYPVAAGVPGRVTVAAGLKPSGG